MTEKQKRALELVKFFAGQRLELYGSNKLLVSFNNEGDIDTFSSLVENYNYELRKEIKGELVTKRLPVIVQTKEHLGRFYIQYTNHNYVCGYRSLEANEVLKLDNDTTLCTSGSTIQEAIHNLWKMVEPNLGKFSSVTFSEEISDILNNLDNE